MCGFSVTCFTYILSFNPQKNRTQPRGSPILQMSLTCLVTQLGEESDPGFPDPKAHGTSLRCETPLPRG